MHDRHGPPDLDMSTGVCFWPMSPQINTEDLIDAQGVADLLGLAQRNTVSLYQKRYPEMPRPVVNLGRGRPRLWLRRDVQRWAISTGRLKDGPS